MSEKHTFDGRGISPLMQEALTRIAADWGPYPSGVYVRTLEAMKKRGLIEERLNRSGNSSRWEYRRVAIAKAEPAGYVDCGECPRISTGCKGRCAKATGSAS